MSTYDEDSYDDLADWPTAPKTIESMRAIEHEGAKIIDGVMVDHLSAKAIVTVYDALNDENKARYLAMDIARMGRLAWKLVKVG